MKKILAVVLCLLMIVAVLGGCSKTPATSSDAGTSSGTTSTDDSSDALTAAEQAIADRKASGENTKMVYSFYTWVGRPAGTDRIQAAVSAHTEEALGIEVELLVMDAASYRQNIPLMFAGGEQVDTFMANGVGLMTAVNSEYIYDMYEDDLFDTYGSEIVTQLPEWALDGCVVGGKLVCLPPNKDIAIQAGLLAIGTQYLDGIGYDYASKFADASEDYIDSSWEELEPIMAELAAKYPDKYVFSSTQSYLGQGMSVDGLAGDNHGVLLDLDVAKVEDLWSSDVWMDVCKRFYKYNQLGYMPADALTSSVTMGARVGAGECMSLLSQGKPGYRTQVSGECSMDTICFHVGETIVKSNACTNVAISINSATEDPVAAMQMLAHFYTCETCANLMLWGEEGKDYKVEESGHIYFADGVDYKNAEWYHTVNWSMPNQQIGKVWKGDTLDVWDRMKKFNNDAKRSIAFGFTWDNADYAMQYTALANVQDQYYKTLILGFSNPETTIPEFVAELKKAGLDEYIAAKTDAFKAWCEDNGVTYAG